MPLYYGGLPYKKKGEDTLMIYCVYADRDIPGSETEQEIKQFIDYERINHGKQRRA